MTLRACITTFYSINSFRLIDRVVDYFLDQMWCIRSLCWTDVLTVLHLSIYVTCISCWVWRVIGSGFFDEWLVIVLVLQLYSRSILLYLHLQITILFGSFWWHLPRYVLHVFTLLMNSYYDMRSNNIKE